MRNALMMPIRQTTLATSASDHTDAEGLVAARCRPIFSSSQARRWVSVQAARQVPSRIAATITPASAALPISMVPEG